MERESPGRVRGRGAARGERPPSAAVTHDLKNLWEKHGRRPAGVKICPCRAHETTAATATTTHCCCCCCNSIPIYAIFLPSATATERDMLCATSFFQLPAGLYILLPVVPAVSTSNFQGLSKKIYQLSRVYGYDFVTSSKSKKEEMNI